MKFLNTSHSEFFSVLRKRVDEYFVAHNISKYANATMVIKTIVMLCMLYIPYTLVVSETVPVWLMLLFTVLMGAGTAGIGMSVMHDANHGAYSRHAFINKIFGYTINIVGGNAHTWKLQHNILHHTYTNIPDMDEDLQSNLFLRFSEHAPVRITQRFQYTYAFLFYALLTVNWFVAKDFIQLFRYHRKGVQTDKKTSMTKEFSIILGTKILYFGYMLAIPLIVMDLPWWQILIGFMVMQFTTGFILSLIFQLAHVVEGTHQPAPDKNGNIENAWAVHQMYTTANFARNNKFLSWYIGGLNFQIEHHLFHGICHVHYPEISKIVEQTAEEFKVPYIQNRTFFGAVASHLRTLKKLGKGEALAA
ncbi:acyl-CoA desaturase [bacterium]|nr:MAG: acyl-CoA desaturase [bacterium]MBL7961439.1 acyl-CoA desaturase [bacterium]